VQIFTGFFIGYMLVLIRCAALVMVAPLFGTKSIPGRIRMGLAVVISGAAFSAAGSPSFANWDSSVALVGAAFAETVIGLTAGLVSRLALDAAAASGQVMGVSMGIGFGAIIDPVHGAESNALGEFLSIITLAIAISMGLHRDVIAWICRSVIETPPGATVNLPTLASAVIGESARSAALAVRVAFPVMAAVTFGHIGLGLLTRMAPQLNLSNMGFGVAILAGGGALYMVAPPAAELIAQTARSALLGL
jgi:flagellar biosynthesis protein FliR